jgi:hypothetical protein
MVPYHAERERAGYDLLSKADSTYSRAFYSSADNSAASSDNAVLSIAAKGIGSMSAGSARLRNKLFSRTSSVPLKPALVTVLHPGKRLRGARHWKSVSSMTSSPPRFRRRRARIPGRSCGHRHRTGTGSPPSPPTPAKASSLTWSYGTAGGHGARTASAAPKDTGLRNLPLKGFEQNHGAIARAARHGKDLKFSARPPPQVTASRTRRLTPTDLRI